LVQAVLLLNLQHHGAGFPKRFSDIIIADVGGNPDGITVADSGNIYIIDINSSQISPGIFTLPIKEQEMLTK
jgi:hypothetical protein